MTKKQKNNVVWMFSISILAFLVLLGSLFYFYKNEDAEQIAFLKNEKSTLISELKLKIIAYDSVISVNNDLKQELLDEKATVQILIEKLETLHADVSDLKGLRNEFYKLKRQVKNKSQVTSVPVATQVVSNVKKEQAIAKAESAIAVTEKPVVIDPDLKMTDFKIRVYSEKKSGSLGNGGSKRNVDVLFVNYLLSKNKNSKPGIANFYIQIFNINNQIVGLNKTVLLQGKELDYSFISEVNHVNSSTFVKETFDISTFNLKQGTYFVNIFDAKANILTSQSFDIK